MVATIVGLDLFGPPCRADSAIPTIDVNNEVGAALSGLFLHYKENEVLRSGHVTDTDIGQTAGFSTKLSILRTLGDFENIFARLDYNFNAGTVTHTDVHMHDSYNAGLTINNVRLEMGKGFVVNDALIIIPVVELEYRNWLRILSPSIAPQSPREDYTFLAPGVAIRSSYSLTSLLALTGRFGVGSMISNTLNNSGTPAAGYPASKQPLGNKTIVEVDVGVNYQFAGHWNVYLDLDYSRFAFGHSTLSLREVEPNSFTNQLSLQLGLARGF
jgi:hypothetical protein